MLLNDTSFENHHGCNIVIKNIKMNLKLQNIDLIYSVPIGKRWKNDSNFLKLLIDVDAIIINGEGTIHDDSEYAYSLLEIVNFTNKPCFLINTTYQNNTKSFSDLVSKFKKVYVRESLSKFELEKFGIESTIVPDMTLYYMDSNLIKSKQNTHTYITDSHDIKLSEKLFYFADNNNNNNNINFLPLISPYNKYYNIKGYIKRIKFRFLYKFGFLINKLIPLKYGYKRFQNVKTEDNLLV